ASFNADGFSLSLDVNPGASREFLWIAIKMDGGQFKLIPLDTPTAIGTQAYSGFGFQPDAVMGFITTEEDLNPTSPTSRSNTLHGGEGFFSFDTELEKALSWCHADDGLTVANNDYKTRALRCGSGTGST